MAGRGGLNTKSVKMVVIDEADVFFEDQNSIRDTETVIKAIDPNKT